MEHLSSGGDSRSSSSEKRSREKQAKKTVGAFEWFQEEEVKRLTNETAMLREALRKATEMAKEESTRLAWNCEEAKKQAEEAEERCNKAKSDAAALARNCEVAKKQAEEAEERCNKAKSDAAASKHKALSARDKFDTWKMEASAAKRMAEGQAQEAQSWCRTLKGQLHELQLESQLRIKDAESQLLQKESEHASQLLKLETEHASQLLKLETEHASQLQQIKTEHASQLQQKETEHASQLQQKETECASQLQLQRKDHELELQRKEQEAAHLAANAEAARQAAEAEAARKVTEAEAARQAAERETARMVAEAETARIAAELDVARMNSRAPDPPQASGVDTNRTPRTTPGPSGRSHGNTPPTPPSVRRLDMSFDGAGTSGAGAVTEAAVEAARMLLGQIPGLSKEKLEERAQQIAEEYGEPTIDELKDDILNALLGQDQVEEFSNKLKMSRHEKRKLSDWLKANGKSGAVLQSNATQVEVEAAMMLLVRIPGLSKAKLAERAQHIATEYGAQTVDELKDLVLEDLYAQAQTEEFCKTLKMNKAEKQKLNDWLDAGGPLPDANGKGGAAPESRSIWNSIMGGMRWVGRKADKVASVTASFKKAKDVVA